MPQLPPFWCSDSVCTPLWFKGEQVLSLLTWIQIVRGCGIALLVLGPLVVLISWLGHLPWLVRLFGVLPLAASGFAWAAAAHIQDTFDYVVQLEQDLLGNYPGPSAYYHFEREITSALQGALLLGWLMVIVAIVLLLACALGVWRGFLFRREKIRNQSAAGLSL
ncbi:MAG: hypothetical protein ACLQUY_02045 [Ktedonobacterales bacterium]